MICFCITSFTHLLLGPCFSVKMLSLLSPTCRNPTIAWEWKLLLLVFFFWAIQAMPILLNYNPLWCVAFPLELNYVYFLLQLLLSVATFLKIQMLIFERKKWSWQFPDATHSLLFFNVSWSFKNCFLFSCLSCVFCSRRTWAHTELPY